MNQLRFSFSLRHGHPHESLAIKKLSEIPASRRATLLRSMIAESIAKASAPFSWSDARESVLSPARYSLYLDPLVESDGPVIDAIQCIPDAFVCDWIRERLCAAVAPSATPAQASVPATQLLMVAAPAPAQALAPAIEPIPATTINQSNRSMRSDLGGLFS